MTNNKVQIKILSTQHDISEETTENIYLGNYRRLADKHVIAYDEYFEEEGCVPSKNSNLIKITADSVEISKKGTVNTRMLFKSKETYKDIYQTPFGSFDMSLETEQLKISETDDSVSVTICYTLSLNHARVSRCTIQMVIEEI